jgi:hypothetical protein
MFERLKCTFNRHKFETAWFGWEPFKEHPLTIRFCIHCDKIQSEYHDLFGPSRPRHYNWENAVGNLGIKPYHRYVNIHHSKWSRDGVVYPKIYEYKENRD